MNGKIGIVTVLYNSETVLPGFFESLEAQTYRNFVLYIIDNKSPDNSLAISEAFKSTSTFTTVVIANDDNYGVAKGNNIGIKQAMADGCEYVLLSNNDVEFDGNTIEELLKGMIDNNAGLIVPKTYFYNTKLIWYAGGGYTLHNGWNTHFDYEQEDKGQRDTTKQVEYAPTCFMLIKTEIFNSVGLMDENYFVYWDDNDFVFRALKKGFKLFYFPNITIQHKESTSTGKLSDFTIYYKYRNFVYFTLMNRNLLYALFLLVVNFAVHLIKHPFTWSFKHWIKGFKAMFDGLKLSIQTNNKN